MFENPSFEVVPPTFSRLLKIWWSFTWRRWSLIALFVAFSAPIVWLIHYNVPNFTNYLSNSMVFLCFFGALICLLFLLLNYILIKDIVGLKYKDFMISLQSSQLPIRRQILRISVKYILCLIGCFFIFSGFGKIIYKIINIENINTIFYIGVYLFDFITDLLVGLFSISYITNPPKGKTGLYLQKTEENQESKITDLATT